MNRFLPALLCVLAVTMVQGQTDSAAPSPAAAATPAPTAAPRGLLPVFVPKAGAPAVVRSAGSRGTTLNGILLCALNPEQGGITTKAKPSLFWFQSKPIRMKFLLSVTEAANPKVVIYNTVGTANVLGLHRIDLSKGKGELKVGVHNWSATVVQDPQDHTKDLIARGIVTRVEMSGDVKAKVAGAKPEELPFVYAEEGYWYDALDAVSDLIDSHPNNALFLKQRAALLTQVGLKKVAAADSQAAAKL